MCVCVCVRVCVCGGNLKGTASGCLGYLFLSKAMRCLE